MLSKKKALILSYSRFPKGDAGAMRQEAFAKMLNDMGYSVFVLGMGQFTGENAVNCEKYSYSSLRNKENDFYSKMNNFFGYAKKLDAFLSTSPKWNLLFVVDLPIKAMNTAYNYSKKNNCDLICDRVEWYSSSEFKLRWLSPEYFRNDLKNRYYFANGWKIVGISSFLISYFEKRGLSALRIPVILDTDTYPYDKKCNSKKTVIIYAGVPSRKDCFDQVIKAVDMVEKAQKLEIRIIGVTESQFISSMSISQEDWSRWKNVIHCLGRLPHDEVLNQYREADYSILIRNSEQRYAKAGFPTKVPESLATGTPVICNLSSDLAYYLYDGRNAVIVDEDTPERIAEAINRAMSYSEVEKCLMRENARKTAINSFDYRRYIERMKAFLEDGANKDEGRNGTV